MRTQIVVEIEKLNSVRPYQYRCLADITCEVAYRDRLNMGYECGRGATVKLNGNTYCRTHAAKILLKMALGEKDD